MKKLISLGFLVLASSAFAQQAPMQPPHNPAFEIARHECHESTPKEANGHPNREAFRACMASKGFAMPQGHHHPEGMPVQQ